MDANFLIDSITDSDLNLVEVDFRPQKYRHGARAILFNSAGQVAVVFERHYNHYKLPGGNLEQNESSLSAVRREMLEEVGAKIDQIKYLGYVESRLMRLRETCIQEYYYARIKGALTKSDWIADEIRHGCEIRWASDLPNALALISSGSSKEYVHLFERARESAAIKKLLTIKTR